MINLLTTQFDRFFQSEKSGGIILMCCTMLSLLLTNLHVQRYVELWQMSIAGHTLVHWINDGLMTIFFLLIGLELEREIYTGHLSNISKAMLPVIAAIGGMLFPAAIYLVANFNGDKDGLGIPMATDIAFALGVLSLLGKRVPLSLKVFLTALAVIDDLGAIIVIAVFYTGTVNMEALGIASGIFGVLVILNRMKVYWLFPYMIGGSVMWYFMSSSGIHPTITGVLLAFAIPFGNGSRESPSYRLQNVLHIPVAYLILPVFAMANTCVLIDSNAITGLGNTVSLGILAGLLLGKPLGIFLFAFFGARFKIGAKPHDLRWNDIAGAGILGGIGFTMSIFITLLAFRDETLIDISKLSIMVASWIAGLLGYFWLKQSLGHNIKFD